MVAGPPAARRRQRRQRHARPRAVLRGDERQHVRHLMPDGPRRRAAHALRGVDAAVSVPARTSRSEARRAVRVVGRITSSAPAGGAPQGSESAGLPALAAVCWALWRAANTARAGNRRFWRAHTKPPYKTNLLCKTLRLLNRPGRARTVGELAELELEQLPRRSRETHTIASLADCRLYGGCVVYTRWHL